MALLADSVLDAALAYLTTNGEDVHICSQEPANVTEAQSTYTLGDKNGITVGSAEDGDASGRKVVVPAITDGDVTGTGTATHWALIKASATAELLAAEALAASQAVTNGNTFGLAAADITIPDAA